MQVIALLEKLRAERYGRMQVVSADSETAIDLDLESIDGDLLLVDGLSKIDPIAKRPIRCEHLFKLEDIQHENLSFFRS